MEQVRNDVYPIDRELSSRITILRVILTVFIVYIHIYNISDVNFSDGNFLMEEQPIWLLGIKSAITQVIARVGVPLFFLVSSVLLYSKPFTWAGNIKKKCRSLLVPYLIWNTFWILFFFTAQTLEFTKPFFATRIIREYSPFKLFACYIPIAGLDASPFCYPLWFLFDLFTLNLLAKAIKVCADRVPLLLIAACACMWILGLELYVVSAEALMFFVLGYFIVKNRWDVKKIDSLSVADVSAAWVVSVLVAIPWFSLYPVTLKASILIGMIFFIKISKIIASGNGILKKVIEWLAPNTFMIYVTHEFTMTVLKKIVVRALPQTYVTQLVEYLMIPLIIVAVCALWSMAFKKTLPKIYNIFVGNR